MKTGKTYIARSAMLTEYLRYMWSRPSRARITVENLTLPRPVPVPVMPGKLVGGHRILGPNPTRDRNSERSIQLPRLAGGGILGLLLMAIGLVILGALPAPAQTSPCPETNVVKFIQLPNLDGGFDVWNSGPWALADDFQCTNTGPI